MIQLKCAELLFLIGSVMWCAASRLNINNKPILVNRFDDDFIGSGFDESADDRFSFTTMRC